MSAIVVVGGGIAGLAVAHEIRRRDRSADVVVLEASERAGGLLRSERSEGFLCEWGASAFLDNVDSGAIALSRELGVELQAASPAARRRWVYRGGRLRAVPTSPPLLFKTDLLSRRGKLRLALEPFVPRARAGVEETIAAFARRRLGPESVDALVAPAVLGIFAGDAERLSLSAAFPRLAELEARHGSLVRGMFASRRKGGSTTWAPRDGVEALPIALARSLGAVVRTRSSVTRIERTAGGFGVVLADGTSVSAGALALALPPKGAASLLAPHDAALAALLAAQTVAGVVVACAGLPRAHVTHALDGFGLLVAAGEPLRCLGIVFESTVWPGRAPDGQVLLRMIYGGTRDPQVLDLPDDELRAVVARDLDRALGLTQAPAFLRFTRIARAIPQYELGHAARVADAERRAAALGIVLAGNTFHGVSVNDCVRNAPAVAAQLTARTKT